MSRLFISSPSAPGLAIVLTPENKSSVVCGTMLVAMFCDKDIDPQIRERFATISIRVFLGTKAEEVKVEIGVGNDALLLFEVAQHKDVVKLNIRDATPLLLKCE